MYLNIAEQIAKELKVKELQINAAIELLDNGATIPFIARYRKEATQGLTDIQLREFETRLIYLKDLEIRKESIIKSINEQGKLTKELEDKIKSCIVKAELEDIYLPYKKKKETKGQLAIKAGLEPLSVLLWENMLLDPEYEAIKYINIDSGYDDTKKVLDGARFIMMEKISEDSDLLTKIRDYLWNNSLIFSKLLDNPFEGYEKYKDYFEFSESIKTIPSHRLLAILRGRNEGNLGVSVDVIYELLAEFHPVEEIIIKHYGLVIDKTLPGYKWIKQVINWSWKIKLKLSMESDLISNARDIAENEAIKVFSKNLKSLLMSAPAKGYTIMGLDPGIRTGVKCSIIDKTGKVLGYDTLYLSSNEFKAENQLLSHIQNYKVNLIAIGNGTYSRETDSFVKKLIKNNNLEVKSIIVNESGASIYSASELASIELSNLDVSIRGAVSIARRLQDPLAELVKIDPKSIGIGQYQHDVNQLELTRTLNNVIEDCVNSVGVELNTASVSLLSKVSGISYQVAENIVKYRDENGAFSNRRELLKVPRLGDKSFEQSAGFLRIENGDNPLDNSSVHPESYFIVNKILDKTNLDIKFIIGNKDILSKLNSKDFIDEHIGEVTVNDIIKELEKPSRDPRKEFKAAGLSEVINDISDLEVGMILEGTITNVTNFGAFVDIGVHQDGLVHISHIKNEFISDPHKVVSTGEIVKVKVIEVDIKRKRISLSMIINREESNKDNLCNLGSKKSLVNKNNKSIVNNIMAEALLNARKK